MTLNPRKSPAVFSSFCAWLFLAPVAPIPVWPFGNECDSPPWTSARWFYREIEGFAYGKDDWWVLWAILGHYKRLRILSAGAFIMGGLAGRLSYWLLWEFDRPR